MKKTKEEIIEEFIERQLLILDRLEYKPYADLRPFIHLTIESAFNFSKKLYANQYKELEEENFKLSAMACIKPTSDDYGNRTCDDKSQCTMIERVRQLESDQEKHRWIDVRNSLPNDDREVIAIGRKFGFAQNRIETDEMLIVCYGNGKWYNDIYRDYNSNSDYFFIIYWRDLPQKPEV